MKQIIQNENLVILIQKLSSTPKTNEDLKIIASLIKGTQVFNKLNELYNQSLSNDGQIKVRLFPNQLCNYFEIKKYSFNELLFPSPKFGVQLLLKGEVEVFYKEEGYIYQHEKLLTKLISSSYLEETFTFKNQEYLSNQLNYRVGMDDTLFLIINKKECDEMYKYYGDVFLFKHKTLIKIIPGLGELNSKRILESIATQFENLSLPHETEITVEKQVGEHLYFLAQGNVQFKLNGENLFNMEESGLIGDELLLDPDQDQSQSVEYQHTVTVKSASVLLYRIKLKIFTRLFPNAIIRQIIILQKCNLFLMFQEKALMRVLVGSKPVHLIKFCTSPSNETKKENIRKSVLVQSKDQIRACDKVDILFQQYQVPKQSRVLKFNQEKRDRYLKKKNQDKNKITINEFVQLTKKNDQPQMKLLEKVENPYDFASNVNAEGFLKQYYSHLIRIGLVKPPMRIAPSNSELICRSRVISAMKLVESTHKSLKPRRTTSAAYGKADPLLQINALITKDSEEKSMQQISKQPLKNKTVTTFLQTPRTQSQPQLLNYQNLTPQYSFESPKCDTPMSRSTMAKSSQPMFRPYSGFMDHSYRLTQQSEIQRRLKRPNQNYF